MSSASQRGSLSAANLNQGHPSRQFSSKPSLKPAPPVVASDSHPKGPHVLPRRFLGPIPGKVYNSPQTEQKRRHVHDLRKRTIARIKEELRDGQWSLSDLAEMESPDGRFRRVTARIRIRRRNKQGEHVEEDLDLDSSSDHELEGQNDTHFGGEKWVGDSFDVGREFMSTVNYKDSQPALSQLNAEEKRTQSVGSKIMKEREEFYRPPISTHTTQETFFTARTEFTNGESSQTASRSSSTVHETGDGLIHENESLNASLHGPTATYNGSPNTHFSLNSSIRPLIEPDGNDDSLVNNKGKETIRSRVASLNSTMPKKLKSALRYNSRQELRAQPVQIGHKSSEGPPGKPKSVQFPIDNVHVISPVIQESGNDKNMPANPVSVLSREGEETQGTSAGATEDAMSSQDDTKGAGDIVLRDRMIVRIGYHREDGLKAFDEATQRRSPCSRLELFEEYIAVWRRGCIELYQDWRLPFKERIMGYKRLCYVIPLNPNRTSLSIFNPDDLTLCLTTSVGKLKRDVDMISKVSTNSRLGNLKTIIGSSRQVQWLKGRRYGSQVFIFKVIERSRALDWYWEIWRDLGGELPSHLYIAAPALSTVIRLRIPGDQESGHIGDTLERFDIDSVIQTCWKILQENTPVNELLSQNKLEGSHDRTDLGLAWKASDGLLDWVAYSATVEGKPRPWAVLAGLARMQDGRILRELQLRNARHQPRMLKLEDGTCINEPAGIEGYLHRLRGNLKETIYLSTHDGESTLRKSFLMMPGCILIASMKEAQPPLSPQKEGSAPPILFSQLHEEFVQNEKRRISLMIRHAAGCVDLRDITKVALHGPSSERDTDSNTFEIIISLGKSVKLEAHSAEVALEWVERLRELISYWKRRHRVEARLRMDAATLAARGNKFAGVAISDGPEEFLADIWDWCTIQGCRPICLSGRVYMKSDKWKKFRGTLVTFMVNEDASFHPRKKQYPLFGAYVYSGLLAYDEMHVAHNHREDPFMIRPRVYQDGLQSSDGSQDTIFCLRLALPGSRWLKKTVNPWDLNQGEIYTPPQLNKSCSDLLIFQARSKVGFKRQATLTAIARKRPLGLGNQFRDGKTVGQDHRDRHSPIVIIHPSHLSAPTHKEKHA
ncbi:hypothetical protein L204_100258 [Cryptococcus depauperatus]